MLRTKRWKTRGRPFGPAPLFLADCVCLDATALLAKSRGVRLVGDESPSGDFSGQWTLQWTDGGRQRYRTVTLPVTSSRQRLGGVRRWWRCPRCHRRCRVLVASSHDAPIGCRLCLRARYATDYPARDRRRRFIALVHALDSGGIDTEQERDVEWLLARRRRGVRRGRRIILRAARALARLNARVMTANDILKTGGF